MTRSQSITHTKSRKAWSSADMLGNCSRVASSFTASNSSKKLETRRKQALTPNDVDVSGDGLKIRLYRVNALALVLILILILIASCPAVGGPDWPLRYYFIRLVI